MLHGKVDTIFLRLEVGVGRWHLRNPPMDAQRFPVHFGLVLVPEVLVRIKLEEETGHLSCPLKQI